MPILSRAGMRSQTPANSFAATSRLLPARRLTPAPSAPLCPHISPGCAVRARCAAADCARRCGRSAPASAISLFRLFELKQPSKLGCGVIAEACHPCRWLALEGGLGALAQPIRIGRRHQIEVGIGAEL